MATPRENFQAVIHHRKPDHLPWLESFLDENLILWIKQGLPVDQLAAIDWEANGIFLMNWPVLRGLSPHQYFGCQGFFGSVFPVEIGPIPRYKQAILSETPTHVEIITETGARVRRRKTGQSIWYDMPQFLQFPVTDVTTWDTYKQRLDPHDPRRYPKDWDHEAYQQAFETYQEGPTTLGITGFYGFGAELMGILSFATAFYEQPDLIHTMIDHWTYFTIETLRDAVETLQHRIDLVYWWEDMANRNGPIISPRLFSKYLLPAYQKVIGFLNQNHITRIMVDSDGNIAPLLPQFVQAGITGLWPLEVQAGMDALQIKKDYGNKLFLIGNLDKAQLAQGGTTMQAEVDAKVPLLKEQGGYIPGADHIIQNDFTLQRFHEYRSYLQQYLPM